MAYGCRGNVDRCWVDTLVDAVGRGKGIGIWEGFWLAIIQEAGLWHLTAVAFTCRGRLLVDTICLSLPKYSRVLTAM